MKLFRMKFAGSAAALALCMSSTMAAASTSASAPSINPLIAVSVFGTQASAQEACGSAATAAAAAGAAAVAQGQAGCVLPATDAPPPVVSEAPPPVQYGSGQRMGFSPIILGLLGIAALAALIASSDGGGDDNDVGGPVSPA